MARRESRISRIDADFVATEGTEDSEIRSKEVGHEGSLIADYADLRGFLGATEGTEGIERIRELVDWGRGQRIFVLTGLGIWGNLGGEVEDCWLEIAARAGP